MGILHEQQRSKKTKPKQKTSNNSKKSFTKHREHNSPTEGAQRVSPPGSAARSGFFSLPNALRDRRAGQRCHNKGEGLKPGGCGRAGLPLLPSGTSAQRQPPAEPGPRRHRRGNPGSDPPSTSRGAGERRSLPAGTAAGPGPRPHRRPSARAGGPAGPRHTLGRGRPALPHAVPVPLRSLRPP